MPIGPKGEYPKDVIRNAAKIMRIPTGEEVDELPLAVRANGILPLGRYHSDARPKS
jgi:hypothetical protein